MKKYTLHCIVLYLFLFIASTASAQNIQVPAGFTATVVAADLGGARHLAFTPQGGLYVKLGRLNNGKGILYLKQGADGRFTQQLAFGDYAGTGICVKGNYLYASSNNEIFRYQLNQKGEPIHPDKPEIVVTGLVNRNRDNAKPVVADNEGHIYVNVGSYINACLIDPNSKKAPNPCPMLDSVGGIWQFSASITNQQYKDGVRYATGFKNSVALSWNSQANSLFLLQHGREQLHETYPDLFTDEQNLQLPSETMYRITKGADGGWPYVYYDHFQHHRMLAPEYGGDGHKLATHASLEPIVAFPAHLAPNGLTFYNGNRFPARYRNGAFIAFHGKSNELKNGYLVAFVPFANGKPSGKWEVFAENFTVEKDVHRPCGIAQGPDGALYVTDDVKGTLYRISYGK